jgi:hypothetical protein
VPVRNDRRLVPEAPGVAGVIVTPFNLSLEFQSALCSQTIALSQVTCPHWMMVIPRLREGLNARSGRGASSPC